MKHFISLFCACLALYSTAQENINIELVGQYETVSSANDIWGYVDKDGIEYAVIGTRDDTNIFSLADPTAPELLYTVTGSNTAWRDMKSYGDYIYSVSDGTEDGLTIIDMSDLENGISHTIYYPELIEVNGQDTISRDIIVNAHNLYIDENGILYMTGCNVLRGAPIFLDLNTDPLEPPVIGHLPSTGDLVEDYAHDIYVRGDTVYASEIYKGQVTLYDITDKSNPIELGGAGTSFRFTHNAWLSDDGKTVFTTDERKNAFVDAYDISEPGNVRKISRFRSRKNGGRVVPHNTHYYKGFLVTSWYGDGVIITDVNRPDNPVIVGRYDTNAEEFDGFVGCWGAYPFLPSGMILASDRQNGLFVLESPYSRAAYLEGCVTDAVTGENIVGAVVDLQNTEVTVGTNLFGNFKTGYASSGTYDVTISKNGYKRQVVSVNVESGLTTELKVALEPAALLATTVKVVDSATGNPVPDAQVLINSLDFQELQISDGSGGFSTNLYEEIYEFTIGVWGYYHKVVSRTLTQNGEVILEVDRGYQDDYYFALGWSVPDTSEWVRENIDADLNGDLGDSHFTNWAPTVSHEFTSPAMDLSIYEEPKISFYAKLFTANAFLIPTLVINGDEIVLDSIRNTDFTWRQFSYEINDFTTEDLAEAYFKFDHQILSGTRHRAEVDAFLVVEGAGPSVVAELNPQAFTLAPNPTSGIVTVNSSEGTIRQVSVLGLDGKMIELKSQLTDRTVILDLSLYRSGIYLIKVDGDQGASKAFKVVKE